MRKFAVVDRSIATPPGVAAALPEVLVPMYWWRGVAMRRAKPVSMTPLERFTLELALTVGRAEPDEFFEITGLPRSLLQIGARRLVAARAMEATEDGFVPCLPGAERAFHSQTLYEDRHANFDIVLLPRTGDLLALDPGTSGLRALEQLRPRSVGNAPVPRPLIGANLAEYLRAGLRNQTIVGIGDDITDVALLPAESPSLAPDGLCPVYRCRGEIHLDGDRYFPSITLPGTGRKEPVTVALPGADGLVERWLALAQAFDDPNSRADAWDAVMGWHEHTAPRADRTAPGRWTCWIAAASARRLAERSQNLGVPLGVTISDEEAVVEITVDLAGADGAAEALIEIDQRLTAAARPGADTTAVPRAAAVWQRGWQLGFPGLVYALRETEDFGYG